MTTIMENAVKEMIKKHSIEIVKKLSEAYNFDYNDGLRKLDLDSINVISKSNNTSRKSKSSCRSDPKIPLPFCGFENKCNCISIRLNHGLYTQCMNPRGSNGYCSTCSKQVNNNTSGAPTYGTISERIALGDKFRDSKGKPPIRYSNVMEKLNISKAEAEEEAAKQGITIPEIEFEKKKVQRGRPKKDVSAVDTSDEDMPKKSRGRPKKEKKIVSDKIDQTEKPISQSNISDELIEDIIENNSDTESEEETAVVMFKIGDKQYLKAQDNTLYDYVTHDEVGVWDEEKKIIKSLNI